MIALHLFVKMIFVVIGNFFIFYFTSFCYFRTIYEKRKNMKKYKRQYRQLSDETINKIRISMRNKPKTEIHKRHIQQSMLRYWNSVPNKPEDLSMDDFLNGNNDDR